MAKEGRCGALDVREFLHGSAAPARRLAAEFAPRLPADTWEVARIPAGARLAFDCPLGSGARALTVALATGERHPLAPPGTPIALSVWRGETFLAAVPVPTGGGDVTIALEPGGGLYTIYLPDAVLAEITALHAAAGELVPAPSRPRWLAYGDSITQGWSASDPGLTYPALAARTHGLDVWNLGFAGSARGEIAAAQHIAAAEADVISLAFGTNNWSAIPTGSVHLAGIVRDFVAVVRSVQPTTPLVMVSPIVRPDAEHTPNVAGATLAQLRAVHERTVLELAQADPALYLVRGADLVRADELVDGIHPGDTGHQQMADAIGRAVAKALAQVAAVTINKEVPA